MSASSSFHLAAAIAAWRAELAASPALRADSLDELESHLRASLPPLLAAGLSEEEAFLIASRRLGPVPAVQREFAKVNPSAIWASRASWMLVGILLVQLLVPVSNFALFLASVIARHLIAVRALQQIVPMAAIFGAEAFLLVALVRIVRARWSGLISPVRSLLARPVLSATCLFALLAAAGELGRHFNGVREFEHGFAPAYPSIPETYQYGRLFLQSLEVGARPFHSGRLLAAALRFLPQLALAVALAVLARRELERSRVSG